MKLTLPRLVTLIIFLGIFAMATRVSADTDMWWHLRAGAWMVEHGQVLTHDEFSSTRFGQPWINHSWLSQIPMFLVWRALGYAGLNLMTAALVTLAFVFVHAQCEGGPFLKAFTLVLAAAASGVYWSARPQLASFALAAAFGYILYLFRWRGTNRLWLLPPLMALWVNLHGGFAIGFILLAITLAGEAASLALNRIAGDGPQGKAWTPELRREGGGSREADLQDVGWREAGVRGTDLRSLGWLAGTALACTAVTPLNPFGAQMLLYPFRTVSIGVLQDFIQEWMSPNFHLREAQVFIWLWLATFAAVGLSRKRIDLTDLFLVSGFTYLALLAARNIALFALVAAPVLTRHAANFQFPMTNDPSRMPGRQYPVLNWTLLAVVLMATVVKVSIPLQPSVNEAAIAQILPVGAAEFVARTRPPGPMFNSYNWGGYLAWALYPDYPVYVDGRTDLYDDVFLREYLAAATGRPEWQAVFRREGVRLVVIETNSLLAETLAQDSGWVKGYADDLAVVYMRAAP